ncbi:hypothetical protein MTY59_45020 [Mycobacterium senriense]|uniref:Uncharacterized protein n=1 Tax=Mycobacterium senriense TaxID=2775496 RepID=A0ABN6ILB0_9MYCO|nr:hypothetical protein MTY59_45020 [Mycobacterium senriense]
MRRQPLGERGARLGGLGRPGDVPDQTFVARTVFAHDRHGLLDTVECGQCGLDFAEFDAVAADLDLLVGAAQIPQLPIGAPGRQVAGAVHACAPVAERARHEP